MEEKAFSNESNGYNKFEVDKYISDLKASYEKLLMDEKLHVLDAEKKALAWKNKAMEIAGREKTIMSALESFKKEEAEGNRNIEILRGEQLRMIYQNLQSFLEELNIKNPGILLNSSYKKLSAAIETVLSTTEAYKNEPVSAGGEIDPMRILLSKMQEKKVQENPREIKIERSVDRDISSFIKPVCADELAKSDSASGESLVDQCLSSKPEEEQPKSLKIHSTGFDLKEAVNPVDDLSEIMKAFDFFNDENNIPNKDDYHFDD